MTLHPIHIQAGWLIDGSGGPVQKHVLLKVSNGIITKVEKFTAGACPDPACLTDLSQFTILPPFVDSHVHLCLSGNPDRHLRANQLVAPYRDIRSVIERNIDRHFQHGILAVRDAGDRHGYVLRYRQGDSGTAETPVPVMTSGRAWHRRGRYGSMVGTHPLEHERLVDGVARETDKADFIKIIQSGPNSLREFGKQTGPQFEPEEMQQTVLWAQAHEKKVMVHANGEIPVRTALEAGCHSIEHGYFMGKENLHRMAEKHIPWIPTLLAMKACSANGKMNGRTDEWIVAEKTLHHQLEQVSLARELGVKIAVGTDAGCSGVEHGESLIPEVKLLILAGYTLPEALECATCNGAELLGLADTIGRLAPGRPANFIAFRGSPDFFLQKSPYPEEIFLAGKPCRRGKTKMAIPEGLNI